MAHDHEQEHGDAPRRTPAIPHGAVALDEIAAELLDEARAASARRAARTLTPGRDAALSQTVLALLAGTALGEHPAPGLATLQVLTGRGELIAGDEHLEVRAGQWTAIPDRPHSLRADEDLVVLLTVSAAR